MIEDALPRFPRMVRYEAVAAVYARLPGTVFVSVINALLIVFVVENGSHGEGYFGWLFCTAAISLARGVAFLRFRADETRTAHIRFWTNLSVIGAFCAGILWGIGPVLPFAPPGPAQWLWAFAIGGMCAGAASLHAAHLPTALAFIIPAALPLAISLLLQGSFQGMAAAAMTVAFVSLTIFTAVLFSREFGRVQNLRVILDAQAQQVSDTNARLSREIADHKTTSEALYQSQKMEALGNLTGGFAHDFNNILTVIIGNLEVINAKSPLASTRTLAAAAITAAESGADLISRLLAFARKQTLNPQCCDIVEVVEAFRSLLLHAVTGNIKVQFNYGVNTATAHIDAAQFQAMLLNLVVNARDAMPDGGQIAIAIDPVQLDAKFLGGTSAVPGNFLAVSVTDNGVGMSPETIARAFEPFFTTKGERGGSGLGLAQVYGFAGQSGGLGQIESRVGAGTRVTMFIPLAEGEVLHAQAAKQISEDAIVPSLSVLLVDDNEAVLTALRAGLAEQSWNIRCVTDPRAALEAVQNGEAFDIVITDIDMPGEMNGRHLAGELKTRFGLPVILMSGVPASQEDGWTEFPILAKPFRKHLLMEKIQAIVGSGQ